MHGGPVNKVGPGSKVGPENELGSGNKVGPGNKVGLSMDMTSNIAKHSQILSTHSRFLKGCRSHKHNKTPAARPFSCKQCLGTPTHMKTQLVFIKMPVILY